MTMSDKERAVSDAPDRIWAFYAPHIAEDENGATIVAYETVQHGAAEYVRSNAIPAVQPTVSPDVAVLVEALRSTLNFIENTEGEMGVILGCGDKARAALARVKGVV